MKKWEKNIRRVRGVEDIEYLVDSVRKSRKKQKKKIVMRTMIQKQRLQILITNLVMLMKNKQQL